MEPQLRNVQKDMPPCSETGMARRVLPVLALNEVNFYSAVEMYSIDDDLSLNVLYFSYLPVTDSFLIKWIFIDEEGRRFL